jgi:AraC-like DNA-binding protein
MPIFMDLHIVPGVTPKEVAEAHSHDVKIQHEFCCRTMTYWIDEDKGSVFCLIEAPDADSVKEMHRKAHGLIPNEIIEVDSRIVESFLGRICDPETFQLAGEANLKVFSDPAFRIILVTKAKDARLLQLELGQEKTQELLLLYNTIVRELLGNFDGREVDRKEDGFILSFASVTNAVECALAIQKRLHVAADLIGLRIGLHAGVPVNKSNELFGDTINLASYLCSIGKDNQILLSAMVRNLYKENDVNALTGRSNVRWLTAAEENFLEALIHTLGEHWRDPQFGVPDFCEVMSISKPQLYRKSMATTGMSPNTLLREYRLLQSINILRNEGQNISEITFNTGFSSPSYFTKCFQKRFGLQPRVYLKAQA